MCIYATLEHKTKNPGAFTAAGKLTQKTKLKKKFRQVFELQCMRS